MNNYSTQKRSIILISKDALGTFYLPTYGNHYWKTPNIDELAAKGTIFQRHYTAAPSSAMSYFSMFTGKFAHETNRKDYLPVVHPEPYDSLFDRAWELGYAPHIIWDAKWMTTAKLYSECYGKHIHYHALEGLRQPVGAHQQHSKPVAIDENKVNLTIERVKNKLEEILANDNIVFIWMHLPHVLYGRNTYGSDIDVYDQIIGIARKLFGDENIFISSDHGNMNGTHGKIGYGFDVYESAIRIPLITPRLNGLSEVVIPTVNCDLFDIIFNRQITYRNYIYSDSAYYCQLNRKLAIIHGKYKYIFNRQGKKEELYDVEWDPAENVNLINDKTYDVDRHLLCPTQELYFYNDWDNIPRIREDMRQECHRIWRTGSFGDRLRSYYLYWGKNIWRILRTYLNKIDIDFEIHHTNK